MEFIEVVVAYNKVSELVVNGMQVSEQPKLEQRLIKISDAFYEVDRKGIKQIKGRYFGDRGFCALGLLFYKTLENDSESALSRKQLDMYVAKYGNDVWVDNDKNGITFKQFGDRFAAIEL
ncbi:MAG: hypothetical protein WCF03_17450 [Nitrososphaeraceae archaeon]